MPNYFVRGCNSGERNCLEKGHFFKVPSSEDGRKKWQAVINRPDLQLTSNHYVCDKHSTPSDIIRQKHLLGPHGEILGVATYKIARLREGAVPTLNSEPVSVRDKGVDGVEKENLSSNLQNDGESATEPS